MAKYSIPFVVIKDDEIYHESSVDVSFTKKDIETLEQFIIDHNFSYEFVDVPGYIYDKCCNKAFELALKEFKDITYPDLGYEVSLCDIIPVSLLSAISVETFERVAENIPEEYLVDDEEENADDEEEDFFPAPTKENTLYLTIKQVYFDMIISGEKKEEYREIKGTTFKKFLAVGDDGEPYIDINVFPQDKWGDYPYEMVFNIFNDGQCPLIAKGDLYYLNLAVGYNKVRDTAKVEVVDITFETVKNKQGNDFRFMVGENGEAIEDANGPYCIWNAVLHLGDVVEKNIVSK